MMRERLPNRRGAVTISFTHVNADGKEFPYTANIGLYDDGRIGEVFLTTGRIGSDQDVATRDSAIALSLLLQHGCDIADIAPAFLRSAAGKPEGPLGTLAEILVTGAWRP